MRSTKRSVKRLRWRILLPFLVLLLLFGVSSVLLTINFVSTALSSRISEELTLYGRVLDDEITDILTRQHSLSAVTDRRLLGGVPSGLAQALELSFLNTDLPQKGQVFWIDWDHDGQFMMSEWDVSEDWIGLPQPAQLYSRPINLDAYFEAAKRLEVELAIFSLRRTEQRALIHFALGSSLFKHAADIERQIQNAFRNPQHKGASAFLATIRVENMPYRIRVAQWGSQPQFYSILAMPFSDMVTAQRQVALGTFAILAVVGLILFIVFLVVIRNITSSLDVLTYVSEKVATGDLAQQLYFESKDEIGRLASVFNDMISNLKRSAADLLAEKNRSEAIIANLPEGIVVTDTRNRLILANALAEKMFDFSFAAVEGKDVTEAIDHQEFIDVIQAQRTHGDRVISRELDFKEASGKRQVYVLSSILAENDDGDEIGVITVLRDITQERELTELRESFLRAISHELRTPLTSVIGFLELVSAGGAGPVSDKQNGYLKIALNESVSLKNLIDDLLVLSQMQAGKINLLVSDIDAGKFLENLIGTYASLADEKNLALSRSPLTDPIIFRGDKKKLQRVFANLMSNALKFTKTGSIELGASQTQEETILYVRDTGIGIEDEAKDRIFDQFTQVDSRANREFEGIGLGLAIVKLLVELHEGRVWVESMLGKGATFYLAIPRNISQASQADDGGDDLDDDSDLRARAGGKRLGIKRG